MSVEAQTKFNKEYWSAFWKGDTHVEYGLIAIAVMLITYMIVPSVFLIIFSLMIVVGVMVDIYVHNFTH